MTDGSWGSWLIATLSYAGYATVSVVIISNYYFDVRCTRVNEQLRVFARGLWMHVVFYLREKNDNFFSFTMLIIYVCLIV